MIQHIKLDKNKNNELFVFPYGIDDFLIFVSCLKKYKEKNEDKNIYLLVLAPEQPAFESKSFIKELAVEYDFVKEVYEMDDVITIKDDRLVVDKKRIDSYIKIYSRYINFDKIVKIEFDPRIKKDDYRYNIYFQTCTLLKLPHEKPKYILPKTSHKKESARKWLENHNITKEDKYVVVQLKSRFINKTIDLKLYKKVLGEINLKDKKIIEMNNNVIEGSVNLKPEEVSNLTTIEILKGADLIISNISYAYQIAGIIGKKAIAIINPKTPAIIRDFCFNFKKDNIVYLATDGTLLEWENIRKECPFIHGNDPFVKEIEIKLDKINFYNPKHQKNKLTKIILTKKEEFKTKIKNEEKVELPLVWYKCDVKSLKFGGYDIHKAFYIKYQCLEGLPQLLAYEELKYDKIKVKLTNIYKPFS